MKRILKYARNHKGITLVLMAIMLAVLLIFASLAIDIAYMYFAKNQLQVAADAAALAGAAKLDGTNGLLQGDARREAWKFACKNTAASKKNEPTNVFLIANGPTDCSTPPANPNLANDPRGDIVIGNWDPTRPVDTRFLPTTTTPLPFNAVINAVKIVAARTSDPPISNVMNGDNSVQVFLGKIFQYMVGRNWSFMNARASAIANVPPRASSFVAVGNNFCPPVGNSDCCPATGSTYPATCNLCSPRELFAAESASPEDKLGWTSLLDQPGSTSEFAALMCGTSPYQEICSGPGIWGIPGVTAATFKDYESLMCDPGFDAGSKDIDPSTGRVTGWEVIIPIVDRTDPMSAPDPNPVWGYAKVHIIQICSPGSPGCRGAGSCISYGYCHGGDKKIVIDRISCISCADSEEMPGLKPSLVR